MTEVALTKPGFDALAYVSLQTATPVSLTLKFRYNESQAQATLCLLQSASILQGFDDVESFVILQYDAENLVPGATSLRPVAFHPGLSRIVRTATPELRRLSLKLKRRCPIWRPFAGSLVSKPGLENQFQHFATLAQAKELHIVFDYAWLPQECLATFQRLVAHPEQLTSYPVGRLYVQRFKRETAFSAHLPASVDSDETTEDEEQPPPYIAASSKRLASISPPSSPPPRKRAVLTLSDAKHTPIREQEKYGPTPGVQDAVQAAVAKILPGVLQSVLPGLVQNAVSQFLPRALEAVLPNLLSGPPMSSPSQPAACQNSISREKKALSVLGTLLTKRVVLGLKQELEGIYEATLSDAIAERTNADTELYEQLHDLKYELVQAQQDLLVELSRTGDDTLNEFKDKCEAEEEEASDRFLEKVVAAYERMSEKLDKEGIQALKAVTRRTAEAQGVKAGRRSGSAPA